MTERTRYGCRYTKEKKHDREFREVVAADAVGGVLFLMLRNVTLKLLMLCTFRYSVLLHYLMADKKRLL